MKEGILKAVIIDDSFQARELLAMMIGELAPNVAILGEAENAADGLEQIALHQPNIVFLDIEMPGKSGLDLLSDLSERDGNFEVIFTTAYNQYAIDAFRLSAIDYLLKPIHEEHLLEAINKVSKSLEMKRDAQKLNVLVNNLKMQNNNTLAIPVNYGYEYLPINEIEFIEAERAYSNIHLINGSKKMISKNMGYFEETLASLGNFVKTHRSFIVNLQHVSAFEKKSEGGIVHLKSGKTVEVSRSNRKELIEKLK